MEWNTVEGAMKTKTDTRTEWKRVGKLGWFMSKTWTATSPPREGEPVGTTKWYSIGITRCFPYSTTRYLQWVQLAILWLLQIKVGEREADSVPFPASDGPHTHRVVGVVVRVPRGDNHASLSTQLSPALVGYCKSNRTYRFKENVIRRNL